jgi:processing peptidase subunit beta
MLTRGSSGYTKASLAEEVENMGAQLTTETDRETTRLSLNCQKGDISRAVKILTDSVGSATLNSAELELAKMEVQANIDANHKDMKRTTMEAVHYNAYRDHQMGQPIRGDPDALAELSVDSLVNFRAANYFGDNIVVVGTGNIDHDSFVQQVGNELARVGQRQVGDRHGTEKCVYVPALLMMRDDEMYNSNVGVFFDAPGRRDPDYYAFLLMQHICGNYRIDMNAEHCNTPLKQYNGMHVMLGDLVDVTLADCEYKAYSDCGIWGNYLFGNEIFTRNMNYTGVHIPCNWADYVSEVEVVRARNSLWNSLMRTESNTDLNSEIGEQVLSVGRRVTRSEVAQRVSHMDAYHIRHLALQWFYDSEPSFTNWGAIEATSSIGSYKYFKINTMNTVMNTHHSLAT